MIIAYTAPMAGHAATTSNLIAIGTLMALERHTRVLITSSQTEKSTMNYAFSRLLTEDALSKEGGIDGLIRHAQAGTIRPETIQDNTKSLLRDRLDILIGPTQESPFLNKTFSKIFENYQKHYDVLMVDVTNKDNELARLILDRADLIVANLAQTKTLLELTKSEVWKNTLKDKEVLYCFGAYDKTGRLNGPRVAKEYGLPIKNVGCVPYNSHFRNAMNDGDVLNFLIKEYAVEKKKMTFEENVYFLVSVREMYEKILNATKMVPMKEERAYA